MKKLRIYSGYEVELEKKSDRFYMTPTGSHKRYVVKDYQQNEEPPYVITFQMSNNAPYDDADYIWANCTGNVVKFYNGGNGRLVDKMYLNSYEPEDYENLDEYCNDILEDTLYELVRLNKNIEPRILHD